MKYAAEVIELMSAYPGRQFKMLELVRHATRARALGPQESDSARKAVRRVLVSLVDCGTVEVEPAAVSGGYAQYSWGKAGHHLVANREANRDNSCGAVRP